VSELRDCCQVNFVLSSTLNSDGSLVPTRHRLLLLGTTLACVNKSMRRGSLLLKINLGVEKLWKGWTMVGEMEGRV
jgi:hypothetical protein